jgi:hypothetical protein
MNLSRKQAALLAVVLLLPSLAVSADKVEGSRLPPEGCEWTPYVSPELGVRLLVAACRDPASRYVFSTVENRIEQHRPSDDRIFGSHVVLEVFSKKPDQPVEAAIDAQFVSRLEPKARASCKVQKQTRGKPLLGNKQTFTILPTGSYSKEIAAELKEGPRDFGCGPYGGGQAMTYFEYHPGESNVRFAFVVVGWDDPLFDENSIEFIKR